MENQNPLSPESAAEIDRLAQKISVANHLDADIQSELRSHLEEKMLAYLSGQEKPSQADALLLTRAHFGNPAVIKALFQQTHTTAHTLSLIRRLVAATAVTVVTSAVIYLLFALLHRAAFGPISSISRPNASWILGSFYTFTSLLQSAMRILCIWFVFAYWRRGMVQGKKYWFETWSIYTLLALIPPLWWFFSDVSWFFHNVAGLSTFYTPAFPMPDFSLPILVALGWIQFVISGTAIVFLWLWWCDRTPHTWRTLLYTLLFYAAFYQIKTLLTPVADMYRHGIAYYSFNPQQQTQLLFYWVYFPLILFGQQILFALLALAAYLANRRRKQGLLSPT